MHPRSVIRKLILLSLMSDRESIYLFPSINEPILRARHWASHWLERLEKEGQPRKETVGTLDWSIRESLIEELLYKCGQVVGKRRGIV